METDKATMEVEAADDGIIAAILVPAGTEGVKVNAVIARLEGEGGAESQAAPDPTVATHRESDTSNGIAASQPPSGDKPTSAAAAADDRVRASPLARRLAKEAGIGLSSIAGSGPHGRVIRSDVEAASAARPENSRAGEQVAMADRDIRALYAEGSYDLKPHDTLRKI